MAVQSTRTSVITFTGDITGTQAEAASANQASPAQSQIVTLASGANTITPPSGGTTPVCCTIVPPAGNTHLITLKGVTGDTGVPLHLTDYTMIAVDTSITSFCLTAAATITGVRLIWS